MFLPLFYANLIELRLKTCGFLLFIAVFILLSFPHSLYTRTAIARQPTISAQNPLAPAYVFWHNRIKNGRSIVRHSVSVVSLYNFKGLRLKTFGFLPFTKVFYSIAVSSLAVHSYSYRSSADNFCSESVCPTLSLSGIIE